MKFVCVLYSRVMAVSQKINDRHGFYYTPLSFPRRAIFHRKLCWRDRSAGVINEIKIRFFFTNIFWPSIPNVPECFQIISHDCYTHLIMVRTFFEYIFYRNSTSCIKEHVTITVYKPVTNRSIIIGNKSILKIVSIFSASMNSSNT